MNRFLMAAAMTVALVSSSGLAAAQDVLVEGPGVKVGESTVLHPRLGIEAGVISNVFFEEASERLSPVMRLIAALDIAQAGDDRLQSMENAEPPSPTVEFRGGVELEYQEYLTDEEAVRDQRHLDVNAIGDLHFFPKSNASFALRDKYQRISRPTNFESSENLTRDVNHFVAELGFHPRGRTLSASVRYENIIDVFESDESEFANRISHIVGAQGKWKFYPYSQLWVDASVGFNDALGDNELLGMEYKISSTPLRLVAGLDTLLSELFTVKAYAGYANGFYAEGPSYNIPIGGVSVGYRYAPEGRVELGYSYDAHDSINANFYADHHIRAGITQALLQAFVFTAGTGVRFREYRGVADQLMPSDSDRSDVIYELNARFAWMLRDRFSLYADYLLHVVDTDFRTSFEGTIDDPSFVRHEAVVGLVAAF